MFTRFSRHKSLSQLSTYFISRGKMRLFASLLAGRLSAYRSATARFLKCFLLFSDFSQNES